MSVIHATTTDGTRVVRYGRRWRLEHPDTPGTWDPRGTWVPTGEAARIAARPDSRVELGLPGGEIFDGIVRDQWRAAEAVSRYESTVYA